MIDKGIVEKNLREVWMMMVMNGLREHRWQSGRNAFGVPGCVMHGREEFFLEILEELSHGGGRGDIVGSGEILKVGEEG